MSRFRCAFKKQIDKKNFSPRARDILRRYGFQTEYHCTIPPDEGQDLCKFHNKERIKDKVDIKEVLEFKNLPRIEEKENYQNEVPLSPYLFVGCHFPNLIFPKKNHNNPLEDLFLFNCEFHGEFDAEDCHFNFLYTDHSRFYQKIHFSGANFHQVASFIGVTFNHEINFSQAHFHKEVDFSYAKFYGKQALHRVKFSGVFFHQRADFSWTQFHLQVHFSVAEFLQEVYFLDTQFHNRTSFSWAQYH